MSWQARVVNVIVRLVIRRRWREWTPGPRGAALLRTVFGQPRFLMAWRATAARVEKTPTAPVGGEWVHPRNGAVDDERTILYLHGGGYVFCTEETHRAITTSLANRARARVYAPAYRLAPEHRFPAAVDDALAATQWLESQGVEASRIVVAGDSAGAGLALAVLVARRDAGLAPVAGALLFSPWTDLAASGESLRTNSGRDVMFLPERFADFAREYLGDAAPTHPLASPLYANLSGLPPLHIQVSTQEVLLDDARRLAVAARAAGVAVTHREWENLCHVWQMFTPWLPEANAALDEAAAFIRATVPVRTKTP